MPCLGGWGGTQGAAGLGSEPWGCHRVPTGLEDVSTYPALVAELLRRNWTEQEVKAALADNLLRVFRKVEEVSGERGARGRTGHGDTGTHG